MRAGRVVGFEALVRWQHPEHGLLGPARFLPVIEGTDLDAELGRWVLREGLTQLAAWRAMGLDIGLSVNVSATQLQTPGFAQELESLLRTFPQLERGIIEIEVLETAALADIDAAGVVLRRCMDLGVGVALDDFGTGYSSLSYFRRLPVKTLKIDQSFVRDMLRNPEDRAIVEGIVRFARAFDRDLVAEGVETPDLCMPLERMGCAVGQGYGIAPPMPSERVPEWTRAFRPPAEWHVRSRAVALLRDSA
jgi:EAL domain-containing protein (putative c-di-GMP-specific phosphodiesterase class I)